MKHLAIVVLLALTGCMSVAQRNEAIRSQLQGWIGQPEGALIREWGVPDRVYEVDGAKYLTYVRSGDTRTGGMTLPAAGQPSVLMGSVSHARSCQYTAIIEQHRVAGFKWDGNACHA